MPQRQVSLFSFSVSKMPRVLGLQEALNKCVKWMNNFISNRLWTEMNRKHSDHCIKYKNTYLGLSLSPRLKQGPRTCEPISIMQIRQHSRRWQGNMMAKTWIGLQRCNDLLLGFLEVIFQEKNSADSFPFIYLNPFVLLHTVCDPGCWPLWIMSNRPLCPLASR